MDSHSHHHTHGSDDPHSHSHSHSHENTLSDANKEYFNQKATSYDAQPGATVFSQIMGSVIRELYEFDEEKTVMMDFACGTGMLGTENT